ncbi:unnamed protein product [Moneuplotes crassus]|uniref:Uncharacterized protein n=1 Tax=Euplotes crassus TaxID=5936 RepID=A0AAD1XM11_EUPCR|nr:unnamed protein product [Moneuplotes crassus]
MIVFSYFTFPNMEADMFQSICDSVDVRLDRISSDCVKSIGKMIKASTEGSCNSIKLLHVSDSKSMNKPYRCPEFSNSLHSIRKRVLCNLFSRCTGKVNINKFIFNSKNFDRVIRLCYASEGIRFRDCSIYCDKLPFKLDEKLNIQVIRFEICEFTDSRKVQMSSMLHALINYLVEGQESLKIDFRVTKIYKKCFYRSIPGWSLKSSKPWTYSLKRNPNRSFSG